MKRTKYNAKKITLDNIQFDSADECKYYVTLKHLQAQGKVASFTLQPELILIPSFKLPCGKTQRAITYTPDFLVKYPDGREEFVDVKGFSTQQGDMRRKIYNYMVYQAWEIEEIPLRWVSASKKYGDEYGFCDYDELQKKRREAKRSDNV